MAEGSQNLATGDNEGDKEKDHECSNIKATTYPGSSDEGEESYDSEES